MFSAKELCFRVLVCLVFVLSTVSLVSIANETSGPLLGKVVDEAMIATIDISIEPDGENLPVGKGSAIDGKLVYQSKCAACHGDEAAGGEGLADPLVGGVGSLASEQPMKTVISFWPYATTLFDYTRRAMPLNAPMSLSNNEVYAVSAYLLHLGGVIAEEYELNEISLPDVVMPNRDGFISVWVPE